jgi:uncharacterized protein YecT (DUF1311 family)
MAVIAFFFALLLSGGALATEIKDDPVDGCMQAPTDTERVSCMCERANFTHSQAAARYDELTQQYPHAATPLRNAQRAYDEFRTAQLAAMAAIDSGSESSMSSCVRASSLDIAELARLPHRIDDR